MAWHKRGLQSQFEAVVLIGPTGAGKTPLGQFLEQHCCGDMRWLHFDFGACLRAIAAHNWIPRHLGPPEIDIVKDVLERGVLLNDNQTPVALSILAAFTEEKQVGESDIVILNGFPRHAGQAAALEKIARVKAVICLTCSPETVCERIKSNAGGDRLGRTDDSAHVVSAKIQLFHERTAPLIAHYRSTGARIIELPVTSASSPENQAQIIEERLKVEIRARLKKNIRYPVWRFLVPRA